MTAVGDEARFRQVLEQLLENESKYAPWAEGVSIGIWRIGDEIQVYVTDDGPGVPIEDWESVFEPFVRIEGRGGVAGSGIGLFAARRLMNAMGGRIFIEPNGYRRVALRGRAPAGLTGLRVSQAGIRRPRLRTRWQPTGRSATCLASRCLPCSRRPRLATERLIDDGAQDRGRVLRRRP